MQKEEEGAAKKRRRVGAFQIDDSDLDEEEQEEQAATEEVPAQEEKKEEEEKPVVAEVKKAEPAKPLSKKEQKKKELEELEALLGTTTTDAQASAGKSSLAFVREGQYVWEMGFKSGENDFYIHDGGLGLKLTASNSQSWSTPSDARIKKNIETIDNSLERVMQMRGVYYNYTTDAESAPRKVGVIAQETLAALPELVDVPKNEEDYLTVRYSEIACVLINAVKELKAQNDALSARVAQLEQH